MNIFTKNIELTTSMEELATRSLDFIDEFSIKESSLSITNTKNEFEFKFTYDVDGKGCITKIKDVDFKKGVQRLRHKSYKTVLNIVRKPVNKESIRKMKPVSENKEKDNKIAYMKIETLEKPMTERDAQDIMIEKRLNDILFINVDCEDSLTMMHRDKDKFKIYITDIELH